MEAVVAAAVDEQVVVRAGPVEDGAAGHGHQMWRRRDDERRRRRDVDADVHVGLRGRRSEQATGEQKCYQRCLCHVSPSGNAVGRSSEGAGRVPARNHEATGT